MGEEEDDVGLSVDHVDPAGADNPFNEVVGNWGTMLEDVHSLAEDYKEAGWETVELHPGDVMVLREESDRTGLDVVVPGDEFADLRSVVNDHSFVSYEVFRATNNRIVYAVVVLESDDGEAAVFVPTYYRAEDVERMLCHDTLDTHVRPLSREEIITFTYEDPAAFIPALDGE